MAGASGWAGEGKNSDCGRTQVVFIFCLKGRAQRKWIMRLNHSETKHCVIAVTDMRQGHNLCSIRRRERSFIRIMGETGLQERLF